jgi:hypothetical protein
MNELPLKAGIAKHNINKLHEMGFNIREGNLIFE